MIDQTAAPEKRQRLAKLFEFLKAYTDMRFPAVRDIAMLDESGRYLKGVWCSGTHR